MPDFRVEHSFNCSEDTFWTKVFFDDEYNRQLYERLKFTSWREVRREEKGGEIHRVVEAVPPVGDLPGPLKALAGDGVAYEERGVFDKAAHRYTVQVVPNRLADKLNVRLEFSTVADGPNRCRRIVKGSVSAKIFGIGGILEKKLIADLEKSYEKSATFTNTWVGEKNLT